MEHKTWLWRRKSLEKTIIASEKSDISLVGNEQEKCKALELDRSLKDLKEQLYSARTESNAKDGLLAKQAKVAEQAIGGWEKAEAEAEFFKQELDDALLQIADAEKRIFSLDAALKECMQQLCVFKEEHQHFINDASMKTSRDHEKTEALTKKLTETNNRLSKLDVENSNLSRILEVKEKLIVALSESKSQLEENFKAMVVRLHSSEKDNASLKYEVCVLQKELDIRNQDRDFHLKSADAVHKKHHESIKKIAKLESECQKLRVMVRKRLPGPAAIAKMRSEVETLSNGATETRKKRSDSAMEAVMLRDFVSANGHGTSSKEVSAFIERLYATEDENKILKEALVKKNNELQSSRVMLARTASKLSQAEIQHEEISKGKICLELARSSPLSYDLPLASISEDSGNEDTVSCAESWASALISELEHFRNGKPTTPSSRSAGVSELSLMDDFIEMEKLAIVSVDKSSESSNILSGERITCAALKETESTLNPSESIGKELVPVSNLSDFSEINPKFQSTYISFEKHPGWLQDILQVIMQKHHITNRSLNSILEDVRLALRNRQPSIKGSPSDFSSVGDTMGQKVVNTSSESLDGACDASVLHNETSKQLFQKDLQNSLCKLIELIDGNIQRSIKGNNGQQILAGNNGSHSPVHLSASPTGHIARIFLWEVSELSAVLEHFVVVCDALLHGNADLQNFVGEVASTLDWIFHHCFSLQDVTTMKETIKKSFHGNDSHSESEYETEVSILGKEDKRDASEGLDFNVGRSLPLSTMSNSLYILSQMEETLSKLKEENRRLRREIRNMESTKRDLEERLESANEKEESLITQLKKSGESHSNLQAKLTTLQDSKRLIEDQIESQKLITAHIESQLTVAKAELNDAHHNFTSLEVELEDKTNCCEELEATCLDLQFQLESAACKKTPQYSTSEEKPLRTDWEVSAASEKLAECQATILNLGKQLKGLADPKDAALFDKVITSPSAVTINHRRRLLDQMHAEDEARFEQFETAETKEIICTKLKQLPTSINSEKNCLGTGVNNSMEGIDHSSLLESTGNFNKSDDQSNRQQDEAAVGRLVSVPKRQKGRTSLLKKLLSGRKKDSSKKLALLTGS